MGTLGDRRGRRKVLLAGAACFGIASLLAAFSTSVGMLIAARQRCWGLPGAAPAPTTLGLISAMFRDAKQRTLAIGVWLTCLIGGAALGPVVGGVMLEHFWWGSVFLLGVRSVLLLLVAGPFLLPEQRNAEAGRLHLPSVALSLASILPIIYGIKELARNGWQPVPLAAIAVGLALGLVFVRTQRSLPDPLLDMRLFTSRAFTVALVSMLLNTMLPGGTMVIITQHLQLVEGLSPLQAGLWMPPAVAASVIGFQLSPRIARRVRPAYCIAAGLLVSVAGLVVLTRSRASRPARPC